MYKVPVIVPLVKVVRRWMNDNFIVEEDESKLATRAATFHKLTPPPTTWVIEMARDVILLKNKNV